MNRRVRLVPLVLALALAVTACSREPVRQAAVPAQPQDGGEAQLSSTVSGADGQAVSAGGITLESAKSIALEDAGTSGEKAEFVKISEERENGRWVYELEFQTDAGLYEYEIDETTGEILSSKLEARKENGESLTLEQVKDLVYSRVPGAGEDDFREMSSEYDDGRLVYEGELIFAGTEYEFEIDGYTGQVLEWEEKRIG